MLKKQLKFKLRSEPDFFKHAQREHSKSFTVFYRENSAGSGAKFVVVVPKKVAGLAVKRNQLKRKFVNAVDGVVENGSSTPLSLVFVAKAGAEDLTQAELGAEINSVIRKLIRRYDGQAV